jgi:hypothetical protein
VFSPDGNHVYFEKAASTQGTEFNFYRSPVLGGAPNLFARDVDSNVTFSPDGQHMAYIRANDPQPGKYRILEANPDGGDETVLSIAVPTRGEAPSFLSWSHDGTHLAYSFLSAGPAASYVESFDIGRKQVHTLAALNNNRIFELQWLPGDRWLMVVSVQGTEIRHAQIALLSRSGVLRPVTRDTNRYFAISLSGDNRSVATVQVKTTVSLALAVPGSGREIKLTPVPQAGDAALVEWTPGGELLSSDGKKITRTGPDGQTSAVLIDDPNAAIVGLSACGSRRRRHTSLDLLQWGALS